MSVSWADMCEEGYSPENALPSLDFEGFDQPFMSEASTSDPMYCCRKPGHSDIEADLLTSLHILDTLDPSKNVECLHAEISRSFNAIDDALNSNLDANLYFNSADVLLRSRHEILFKVSMLCLGKNPNKSDMKFCDISPISSERTPDYIEVSGDDIMIMEFTASSNVDRAFASKGKIEKGYQPKYNQEKTELEILGKVVDYIVVVFDMKDPHNKEYLTDLKKVCNKSSTSLVDREVRKLESIRRLYIEMNQKMDRRMFTYMSTLFSLNYINKEIPYETISFLTEPGEDETPSFYLTGVSQNVFNKITGSWPRLSGMVDDLNAHDSDEKFYLKLDIVKNRFSFVPCTNMRSGLGPTEWSYVISNLDKSTLIRNLSLYVGDIPHKESKIDVEYFDVCKRNTVEVCVGDKIQFEHDQAYCIKEKYVIKDMNKFKNVNVLEGLRPVYSSKDYHQKLQDMVNKVFEVEDFEEYINSGFGEKTPFITNMVCKEQFAEACRLYSTQYYADNDFSSQSQIKIRHQKPSFSYPLFYIGSSKYIDYRTKDNAFIEKLLHLELGPYTDIIIKKICSPQFSFGSKPKELSSKVKELLARQTELQREMNSMRQDFFNKNKVYKRIKEIPGGEDLLKKLRDLGSLLKKENPSGNKNLSMFRLTTKKKSETGKLFQIEMEHFKKKDERSSFKGVGRFNHDTLQSEFLTLTNEMISPSEITCPDELYDEHVSDDCLLLSQLKKDYVGGFKRCHETLRNMNLYHSSAFVSRFCHTLAYFSQTSIGSDYIMADNLGYENVLLIMKGGKKIFKTKKSKLYRLIFPTYSSGVNWYHRSGYSSNFRILNLNETDVFCMTPWMNLDETMLNDGLTFLSRTMGYSILNSSDSNVMETMPKVMFNILLAFNNRRKLEAMMHNMRYITVNCMSEIANVSKMLPEMSGFNYDFFQCYIRECLNEKFYTFACKLKELHDHGEVSISNKMMELELKHPMNPSFEIRDLEDLTLAIYSTFLMSKAPTNQALDQVANLKDMLETHIYHRNTRHSDFQSQYINSTVDAEKCEDFKDYWSRLFSNDFFYDPKYVNILGSFAASYIRNSHTSDELASKWENLLKQPWDSMSNTSGLRSDPGKEFFGRKGYYVVYKKILDDIEYLPRLNRILLSDLSDDKKKKEFHRLNQTYAEKMNDHGMECLVFHVVDKKQRGGRREIFVMDYKTKLHQQPIEKFAKYLCKMFPNEMISIPSNRRLFHIHTNVFERRTKDESLEYNAVLDCRRWAPHSVINKFTDFILAMREVLPQTFVTHCIKFMEMMYKKKVYTREYVYNILKNNQSTPKEYLDEFTCDDRSKGYFFYMPYSWMMGIFNYLSSLLHVVNQMHVSHMIMVASTRVDLTTTHYHMIAHSDDSAGKIFTNSITSLRKSFLIYECMLKSCNHMLSDKKCNIGRMYFEFLSILYIANRLLSLLAKYTGAFSFHPTDKGYAMDISESYSKCIELIANGATFDKSYIALKIYVKMIHRFYFQSKFNSGLYSIPPQIMGVPDSHPLMILICGADSDLIRLRHTLGAEKFSEFLFVSKCLNEQEDLQDSFISAVVSSPSLIIRKENKSLMERFDPSTLDEGMTWVMKNVNLENTGSNTLKFLMMLRDKNFCASLQDETITRRLSRAFYYRSSVCVGKPGFQMTYKEMMEMITIFLNMDLMSEVDDKIKQFVDDLKQQLDSYKDIVGTETIKIFDLLHSETLHFYNAMNCISYKPEQISIKHKTCKPIHINVQKTGTPIPTDYSPEALTAWIKYPNTRWLLPIYGYNSKLSLIDSYLVSNNLSITDFSTNSLYKLLSKFKQKYLKEMFIYSNMPHGARDVSTYKDVLMFLAENSMKNRTITGIVSPYGRSMTHQFPDALGEYIDENSKKAIGLLDFYTSIFNNHRLMQRFESLTMNPEFLGIQTGGNMQSLLRNLYRHFENIVGLNVLISPHFNSALKLNRDGIIFSKDHLNNSYYHCFIKRQYLLGNVWLGTGQLFFNLGGFQVILYLEGSTVQRLVCNSKNYVLNRIDLMYMESVLQKAQLGSIKNSLKTGILTDWERPRFGVDSFGNLGVHQTRLLEAYIKDTQFSSMIHIPVSHPENRFVRMDKRMGYLFKNDEFSDKCYRVKTFETEPEDIMNSLNCLFSNETNRRILDKTAEEYQTFFESFIGEATEIDLKVELRDMIDHYKISQVYKIFKTLRDSEKLSFKNLRLREPRYPGQEGGLLNILVEYKHLNPSFRFNYESIITPELMYLKSSQPEAFISDLVGNVRQKFNSLYTETDKRQIIRSLNAVVKSKNEEESASKLINTMTSWGYVGVMGSMESFVSAKLETAHETFIFDPYNETLVGFSKQAYRVFIEAILKSCSELEIYPNTCYLGVQLPRSDHELEMFLLSHTHLYILSGYNDTTDNHYTIQLSDVLLAECLSILFRYPELKHRIEVHFEEYPILSSIDVMSLKSNEFAMLLSNCINTLVSSATVEQYLSIESSNPRFPDDFELPYTKTKDLLNEIINFSARNVRLHGIVSVEFYQFLNKSHLIEYKGRAIHVKMRTTGLSNVKVNFNPGYMMIRPLEPSFISSEDGVELLSELGMSPIEDYVKEMPVEYQKPYERRVLVRTRRGTGMVKNYEVSVVNLVGCGTSSNCLIKIRQVGETLLLITDRIFAEYLQLDNNENFKFFKPKEQPWYNKSLVSFDHLFYIIWDSIPVDIGFWCFMLNCNPLDINDISHQSGVHMTTTYRDYMGKIEEDFFKNPTLEEVLDRLSEENEWASKLKAKHLEFPDEEEEEDEQKEVILTKADELIQQLRNRGVESEFLDKYSKIVNRMRDSRDILSTENMSSVLESIMGSEGIRNKLESAIEATLGMIKDSQTIERVWQVPGVYATGKPSDSFIKNRSLKDSRIRAEIESVYQGLANKILSSNLRVSSEMRNDFARQIKLCRMYAKNTKKDGQNKMFLLDLIVTISNDAWTTDEEHADNGMFMDLMIKLNRMIVNDEEEEDSDDDVYSSAPDKGTLRYRIFN
jgi:hypothetical protein